MNPIKDSQLKYFRGLKWAVFNCHESDKRKGRLAVLQQFGESGWRKVLKINRTGIMSMFNLPPIPETQLYANIVGLSADERCSKESDSKHNNKTNTTT